jgi:hypothetical protein
MLLRSLTFSQLRRSSISLIKRLTNWKPKKSPGSRKWRGKPKRGLLSELFNLPFDLNLTLQESRPETVPVPPLNRIDLSQATYSKSTETLQVTFSTRHRNLSISVTLNLPLTPKPTNYWKEATSTLQSNHWASNSG